MVSEDTPHAVQDGSRWGTWMGGECLGERKAGEDGPTVGSPSSRSMGSHGRGAWVWRRQILPAEQPARSGRRLRSGPSRPSAEEAPGILRPAQARRRFLQRADRPPRSPRGGSPPHKKAAGLEFFPTQEASSVELKNRGSGNVFKGTQKKVQLLCVYVCIYLFGKFMLPPTRMRRLTRI